MTTESDAGGRATVEILLIRLDEPGAAKDLTAEFSFLNDQGVVRLVDELVVTQQDDQTIDAEARTWLSPTERESFRHRMKEAVGFVTDEDRPGTGLAWRGASAVLGPADATLLAGVLRPGQVALAVVFEHRWSMQLRRLIDGRRATLLEDDLVPSELLAGQGARSPW